MSPTPVEIKELRKRHHITQKQLADSLYGVKVQRIADYEAGRRKCRPLTWWAIVLTWDKKDLWVEEQG